MSDLISRSDVIQILKECNLDETLFEKDVFDKINNLPTAYDIDKVVCEFEKIRAKDTCNKEKCDTKEICRICVVDDAIEIVKHGGVSDDACEWRLCDEEANVYDTSCRNLHILIEGTPRENNYEFCPYCGKKIKIAGD